MLTIDLKPEYVLSVRGLLVTNTFLTSVLVTVILAILALIFYTNRENDKNFIANGLRIIIFELFKFIDLVTEDRELSKKVLPLVATFFIFIITANLLALIPGFLGSFFVKTANGSFPILRSPNSSLATTLALALFSVFSIQFFSFRILGMRGYLARFFNFSSPVKFILGFFEMLSELVKIISFSFRLFGNIFAGEVLILVTAFLMPYIIPVPFMILEVFVGIIQAFIFAALTLTFIEASITRRIGSSAQNKKLKTI